MKFDLKKNAPHFIAIVVILLINVFYFFPQFQGKVLKSADITSHQGMSREAREYRKETGEEALWTNSMFGGMPTYSISMLPQNNISRTLESMLHFYIPRPAGMFILGMISFYLALLLLGVNPWIALVMSIIASFSTGNLMLYGAGHMTKIRALMLSAPVVAGVVLVMRGRYWLGGLVFSLFLAMNIGCNHPQMTYYLGLVLAIYMIIELVNAIREKKHMAFLKGASILVFCSLVALGTSASKLMPIYEYGKHTMRGDAILSSGASGAESSSTTDGLNWDYAMNWSAGYLDIISTFIPYAAGGGTVEEYPKTSKYAKLTGQRRAVSSYSYFGVLPDTAGPYYFGAILFFLFILGALIVPGKFKWWLIAGTILTLLMAMGKNAEILNRILFDYFPLFSKFRTPNSVFSLTGILFTFLAGLGLNQIIKSEEKEEYIKPALISMGAVGGFSVLFALLGPSMISFASAYDSRLGADQRILDALYDDRASMLSASAWRTAGFVLVAGALVWAYLKSKISKGILLAVIAVLAISDTLLISKNYFSANYVTPNQNRSTFVKRAVDNQILADKDIHYRVQDFTINTYNSSISSYHHKTIGGYSPVKLQRIQDVNERHLGNRSQEQPFGNQKVLNMMNAKYFILPDGNGNEAAQRNPESLGNAWFINNIQIVENANAEIDGLTTFNPKTTAIVHKEFKDYTGSTNYDGSGTITLTSYSPNELTYTSNSSSEQFAVFSEVWYGPELGWQAYIDDKPVDHIRSNYLLRAMKIPAGQHTIRFEFKPSSYKIGGMISLISSILILLMGGVTGYKAWKD